MYIELKRNEKKMILGIIVTITFEIISMI